MGGGESGAGGGEIRPRSPEGDGGSHLGEDQRGRGRVGKAGEVAGERAPGQAGPATQRYEVQYEDEARQDLKLLKKWDIKAWREIQKLFDTLETTPDLGYELGGAWAGCMAVHVGKDRYRVIWELFPPEDDYSGLADQVVPVVILRVGPKTDRRGRTIYERAKRPGQLEP
jgi:mRNA-degrading endonuclease RelE of RelBE toxin-antitoxin system